MSRTSRKLDEARFFLQKLRASVDEPTEFDFYFSAFVSSARSVTWVLRAEYKDYPGWLNWYKDKKPESTEERLLNKMNTLRVRSEKFNPLTTRAAIVMNIPPEDVTPDIRELLAKGIGKRFRAWVYEIPEDGTTSPLPDIPEGATIIKSTLEGFQRHVPELGDQDVLVACELYFSSLENLVSEAETVANAA